jgi:hypothetical protein
MSSVGVTLRTSAGTRNTTAGPVSRSHLGKDGITDPHDGERQRAASSATPKTAFRNPDRAQMRAS